MDKSREMRIDKSNIWVHPNAIIRLFDKSVKKLGKNELLNKRTYLVTRETWIGSVFLLGVRELTGRTWYLRVNPEQSAIEDLFACSFVEVDKTRTQKELAPIQVFTHQKSSIGGVFDAIKRKLEETDLKNCFLVCYLMKNERIILKELNKKLQSISPQLAEIWIIGLVNPVDRIMRVFKAYPNILTTLIDLNKNYQTSEEKTFIYPFFGRRKGSLFEPLGKKIHLKPDFIFEEIPQRLGFINP